MMAPIFEQAAARMEPRVRFGKLDTEKDEMIASQFGIQGIPTLVFFDKGREIARQSGAMGLDSLIGWINSLI